MAKKNDTQKIKDGTKAIFKAYEGEDQEGNLEEGDELVITGYDYEEETYAVEVLGETDEDGEPITDALYEEEFEVVADDEVKKKPAPRKKAASKKTAGKKAAPKKAAPKAEEVEEEEAEEEEEAPAPKKSTRKSAAKPAAKPKATKAAKDKAKAKPKGDEDSEPEYTHKFKKLASVTNAMKATDNDAIAAVAKVIEEREHAKFTIGGLLAYIKRQRLHTKIEDEETGEQLYPDTRNGFHAFVRDNYDIQGRVAEYLVDIYETLSQFVTEAQIGKIGWTKLRELLPARALFDSKETVLDWLEFARENTTGDVKEKVKKELVESGVETHGNTKDSTKTTFKLSFHDDQMNVLNKALDFVRQEQEGDEGEMTDSEAFYEIASRFIMAEGVE